MARVELLVALRASGQRQVDVARALGVSPARVSQVLAPGGNPTLLTVERFAAALGRRVEIKIVASIEEA